MVGHSNETLRYPGGVLWRRRLGVGHQDDDLNLAIHEPGKKTGISKEDHIP